MNKKTNEINAKTVSSDTVIGKKEIFSDERMRNFAFCPNCNELVEEEVCPHCKTAARTPKDDDMCRFAELDATQHCMFSEALGSNGVRYAAMQIYGGYSMTNRPSSYRYFVRYDQLDTAREIFDTLFGGNADEDVNVIDRLVTVTIDRPLGSVHPRHPNIIYPINYGYVEGVIGGDGEEQDAYVLGVSVPVSTFEGYVVAVIYRKNDVETKWVVAPVGKTYTKEQIEEAVRFQEQYFDIEIIM